MGGCESKTAEELVDVEDDIYYRQVEWRTCAAATPLPLFVLPVLTGLDFSSTALRRDKRSSEEGIGDAKSLAPNEHSPRVDSRF